MKSLHLFCLLAVAAIIMPLQALHAQSYTDIYGNYNYKGNLKVRDTAFLKRLIAGDCALDSSALVQFNSTSKGILVPRLSTVQKNSILNPAQGLLVYDITLGCFFYYSGSTWAGLGACSGSWTSAGGGKVDSTMILQYNATDSTKSGLVIGSVGPVNGVSFVDSASSGVAFMGTGDFTNSIGTKNTAAMIGGNGDNSGGIAVQPDNNGSYKVITVTKNGNQQTATIIDSSFYQLVSYDGNRHSVIDALPGLIAISQTDSNNVENGIRAVDGGLDLEIGNNLISFNNFSYPLQQDMVFKVNGPGAGAVDYIHSTHDSFLVAGTLQVNDGTQGAGKVLTSDANGKATWQSAGGAGWGLNGNGSTDATTNYIGTSDSTGLTFKTANKIFGHVDSVQRFDFNTQIDSERLGIYTSDNLAGIGVKGIFVGDESARFGFYQLDATQFGFSKHLVLIGDTNNNHVLVDDSILQLQSTRDIYIQAQRQILLGGNDAPSSGVGMSGNYICINGGQPSDYNNSVSDSCNLNSELIVGYSPGVDGNTLTGGMSISNNILLGDWASMSGNQLVGHGIINGLYPGMSENFLATASHIDSNYLEGAVLMWNLGHGADNSSWSNNYLKNLSGEINMQDIAGQYNERVVSDTITGDHSGINNITLLGNDSIAFNTLSGTSSSIRDILMHNSSLNYNKLAIMNAGVIASQFFNSNITGVNNQIYSSVFFNTNKDFSTDSTPWNNVMLIGDNVGIGITSKPTASFQIGDNSNSQTFRYVDGQQGIGKVLTSDKDGNASWQTLMGGGGSGWGFYGNTGTNPGYNYLGTSDNTGLVFKTAGVTFGYIDSAQMYNFYTGLDSDNYGVSTTNNVAGDSLSGVFIGDETAGVGFFTIDGTPFGFSKHVCIAGDVDMTHILRDDSLINIKSAGTMMLNADQGIQISSNNAAIALNGQMIAEFNPNILPDSIADSSSVNSNIIISGATYGNNTLSGGAILTGNYLADAGSSCVGNVLVGNGGSHENQSELFSNEMFAASHIDSNYLEGIARMWGVGKHSTYSTFSRNYLKNISNQVQLSGIRGESGEYVVEDTIIGDGSGIFNLTLMSFDTVAYNVLTGANTNINNLIMQNSSLNYCHFSSPNTGFSFSQLLNSHLVNDTVDVVNCFFHNVNKDFITETQTWQNIMLLNDNVGIGITSMPTAALQVGDSTNKQTFRYVDGNQDNGKVLTSDAYGNATWQYMVNGVQFDSTAYFTPGASDSIGPADTIVISDTVAVIPYRYNIIDSTGTLNDLTISLPASPVEGEWVEVKLAQSHVLVHYINGTVVNSAPAFIQPENLYIKLVFRASKNTWY